MQAYTASFGRAPPCIVQCESHTTAGSLSSSAGGAAHRLAHRQALARQRENREGPACRGATGGVLPAGGEEGGVSGVARRLQWPCDDADRAGEPRGGRAGGGRAPLGRVPRAMPPRTRARAAAAALQRAGAASGARVGAMAGTGVAGVPASKAELACVLINVSLYALCYQIQQPVLPYIVQRLGTDVATDFAAVSDAFSF